MIRADDLFDLSHTAASALFREGEDAYLALTRIKDEIINIGKNSGYPEISEGIFLHPEASIDKSATILPPCVIGRSEIRPGAYIRGNVIIGDGAVIGNSTEIKNAIIFDGAQLPHYNYVGDSVIGYRGHLGAGAIASNFRLDHKSVKINIDGERIDTGLRKLGVLLGDRAEVGCGSVLCPGTVIGRDAVVYPLSCVTGVVGEGEKFKGGRD